MPRLFHWVIGFYSSSSSGRMAIWASVSWSLSTTEGEPIMRSTPEPFLGKAMVSRILGMSRSSMKMRSRPGAQPAWGGAPNLKAVRRPPKRSSTYFLP